MDNTNNVSDHDTLVRLVEKVENLIKTQSEFHKEMRDGLENLKTNYSDRITELEITRAKVGAEISELNRDNKKLNNWMRGLTIGLIGSLLGIVGQLLNKF